MLLYYVRFGTKIWPYAQIRNKVMFPVSNKPIVAYSVDALTSMGFDNIILVAGPFADEIRAYFRDYSNVTVIVENAPKGTAFSLLAADYVKGESFLALYGDTIVSVDDLKSLWPHLKRAGSPKRWFLRLRSAVRIISAAILKTAVLKKFGVTPAAKAHISSAVLLCPPHFLKRCALIPPLPLY